MIWLDKPRLQLCFQNIFQVLISYFFLVIHVERKLSAVNTRKFSSQGPQHRTLLCLCAGAKTLDQYMLDGRILLFF